MSYCQYPYDSRGVIAGSGSLDAVAFKNGFEGCVEREDSVQVGGEEDYR